VRTQEIVELVSSGQTGLAKSVGRFVERICWRRQILRSWRKKSKQNREGTAPVWVLRKEDLRLRKRRKKTRKEKASEMEMTDVPERSFAKNSETGDVNEPRKEEL